MLALWLKVWVRKLEHTRYRAGTKLSWVHIELLLLGHTGWLTLNLSRTISGELLARRWEEE